MNIFTQFFRNKDQNTVDRERVLHDLMKRESELSKDIFGKVKPGSTREFFCLDMNTWVWYESWVDEQGQKHDVMTRYVVRETEVVKSQNGGAYHRLTVSEAKNFRNAVNAYHAKIKNNLYTRPKPA